MTPQELLSLTISNESTKDGTDFQEIVHRGVAKKAKVEYGDFRKATQSTVEIDQISDEISFLNVVADVVQRGDDIIFDSQKYNIEHFTKVTNNIYNIFATQKARTGGSRLR